MKNSIGYKKRDGSGQLGRCLVLDIATLVPLRG